jgi:hypothetical protein
LGGLGWGGRREGASYGERAREAGCARVFGGDGVGGGGGSAGGRSERRSRAKYTSTFSRGVISCREGISSRGPSRARVRGWEGGGPPPPAPPAKSPRRAKDMGIGRAGERERTSPGCG